MDTLQAAILIEKLKIFEDEVLAKQTIADNYSSNLSENIKTPVIDTNSISVWAQYTIQIDRRDFIAQTLAKEGIPTAIYYLKPLHLQEAYKNYPKASEKLSNSEKLAERVLSLPMHPYLNPISQDRIIDTLNQATKLV